MTDPLLVVTAGLKQGYTEVIDTRGIRIGRDPGNELFLDDPEISRHHARVILHNGAVWIQDAGSRNGVFVNGNRVTGHLQLSPGDQIVIGTHEFLIKLPTAGTESSVSVNMDSLLRPEPKSRRGTYLLLGLLALVVVSLVVFRAGNGQAQAPETVASNDGTASYGVTNLFGSEDGGASDAPDPAPSDVAAELANQLDGESDDIPPLEEGVTLADLTGRADTLYRTGQLRRALIMYRQGQMLDPECAICQSRIDKLSTEISEKIDVHYGDGVRYTGAFQYEQAVQAFQTVLLLAPPESSIYLKAEEKLREAQQKLGRPF